MDAERATAASELYVRGRDVVTSYLTGADVAWDGEDEGILEVLSRSGRHRRIRLSVTETDGWAVPLAFAGAEPPLAADGWWAFVRVDPAGVRESEVYLAPEHDVRELLREIVLVERADEPLPDLAQVELVLLNDSDIRPLLRTWGELTLTD
ncbi:MAG: hypothetical protein ACYC1Z_03000 [Georgenia sp.]